MVESFKLENILSKLIEFRNERDWKQFHKPKELATAISIEASELQEHFLWRESESINEILKDTNRMKQIRMEIADIAIYLLYLIHDLKIDLSKSIIEKLELNKEKYPKEQYKGKF
jgi:NTP pyrophosphatase (non-canonical NTP hydrolase)